MSNVFGILIGVLLLAAGIVLLFSWWGLFVKMLMAVIPVSLILIGAGALIFFISEMKSRRGAKEEPPPGATKSAP